MFNPFAKQVTVEEIHEAFDTAQDRLLKQAQEVLAKADESKISLADRYKQIGFTNVPIVKQVQTLRTQVVKSKEQAELILYYKKEYPFLKFLTEDELNSLCEKYGLIHAPIANYTKDVPERNLAEIEKSQALSGKDRPRNETYYIAKYYAWLFSDGSFGSMLNKRKIVKRFGYKWREWSMSNINETIRSEFGWTKKWYVDSMKEYAEDKQGLFICAPQSHFDLSGLSQMSKHGFLSVSITEIPDPIVFRYCRGGVQVLSKWGEEAKDEKLTVEGLN